MDLWVLTESYLLKDYFKYGLTPQPGWTILDIGAGIGDFSILVAQLSPKNKIYAIEPFKKSFNLLKKNIKINNLNNIKTYKLAISSSDKNLEININPKNFGNNSTINTNKTKNIAKSTSLHKFITDNHIKHINLLKCDCEGAEYDIFSKFNISLFKKIDNIIMEYHLFSHNQLELDSLIKNFINLGYKVYTYPNPVHSSIGFISAQKISPIVLNRHQ